MTKSMEVRRQYEAPRLILLGEINRGLGYSCVDGAIVGVVCIAGSGDGGTSCGDGDAATLGGCAPGGTNTGAY